MADVNNILEPQQIVSTLIKELQTEPVKDSNTSYSKQLSPASEQCVDEETGHENKNGFQADVSNIREFQDRLNSPGKQLQTELVKNFNSIYVEQLPTSREKCVDQETVDEDKNNFQVYLSNIRKPQKMLTSSVNQLQTKPIRESITAYFEQLFTTNEEYDNEEKIEKDKNCLQQSAISSNVNRDTEMVTAAKELRTLNYNFIIIIIIIIIRK